MTAASSLRDSASSASPIALVRLIILWLGTGQPTANATAFVLCFFPIAVNVATGLSTVEPEVEDVLRSLGASKPDLIRRIGLPRAMPYFFASLNIRSRSPSPVFLWTGLLTGAAGLGVGTWILNVIDPNKLNIGLGLMLFLYIGLRVFSPQFALADRTASRLAPVVGFLGGIAQGSTGLCAAVIVPFLQSTRMSRTAIIFTISTVFLIFSIVQFFAFLIAGLIEASFLVEGVLALIPVMLFMPLGGWLSPRLPKKTFDRVFLVVLAVVAIGLIEKGL